MIKKYKTAIIIFVVALALRLVFVFFLFGSADFNSEKFLSSIHSDGYYEAAYNLIHHKIFSLNSAPPFISDSTRTPGYPLMMAASLFIFNSLWPLLISQIIIGSILPLLGRMISREIMSSGKIANLVGWLLAVEPVGILLSTWLISETMFAFFLFLFIWLIIKFIKVTEQGSGAVLNNYRTIAWAAFLLGIATLIRPTVYYLPIILIAAWFGYRYFSKSGYLLKQIVVFLGIFILILSPWFYRNYKTFGVVAITSTKEDVMFGALAPSVLALKNHEGYSKSQINFFKSKGFERYPVINLDKAGWFQEQALEVLINNPKESLIVAGISLFTFFTNDGMLTFLGFLGLANFNGLTLGRLLSQPMPEMISTLNKLFLSPAFLIMLIRISWVLITILFLLDIIHILLKKKLTSLQVLAFIFVAYFALTTISNGFGVNARFRFPVNVFVFMFAAAALVRIISTYKYKNI